MNRVNRIIGHLQVSGANLRANPTSGEGIDNSNNNQELGQYRWDGWGYNDSSFRINEKGLVELTGSRYLFSGHALPDLRKFFEEKIGIDISDTVPTQSNIKVPSPIVNADFVEAIKGQYKKASDSEQQRLFHGHGHTAQEVYELRHGSYKRVPDWVVWPASHENVEAIVQAAHKHNVVLIPYGGGTSVSHALICPTEEKRMIVSVDMHLMNKIKWVNRKNMLACVEAGIVGKDLEQKLKALGLCTGHEPDSSEFSTLGGWISTRASGMKKNKYGNIEDIVVKSRLVTPSGTVEKNIAVPRMSAGPDINEMVLGSEGTLGIVTEAVIKVRTLPEATKFGSLIFPDFESGVACLYEVAMQKVAPVSIRLVDNLQFQFGQALKPGSHDWKKKLVDKAKKWYVLHKLKFDPDTMVAATLLFEGTKSSIAQQEKTLYQIAAKYGGMNAGEENGVRGYFLTYMIAYLRDFGLTFRFVGESFETSVPYENLLAVCTNVKQRIKDDAAELGVQGTPFVSCRVTQLYDTGACVYFYLGCSTKGLSDPMGVFSTIEHNARDEIIKLGGSISHHHGVGKHRKAWMGDTYSKPALAMLKGIKKEMDPNNVFANGNLLD